MNETTKLTATEIRERVSRLSGWKYQNDALERTMKLGSFADAIAFMTRLAFDAEAADHHPDLTVSYRTVTVRWTTHSADGVTEKDFAGIAQTDAIAARFGVK